MYYHHYYYCYCCCVEQNRTIEGFKRVSLILLTQV